MTDKEREKREKLLQLVKLMQENPELPIVPVVEEKTYTHGYDLKIARFGNVEIDEYLLIWGGSRLLLKSEDDVFSVLVECLNKDIYCQLPEGEEKCLPIYDALPWKKAIIVYIEPLEESDMEQEVN